jgi:hypothetical protein
MWKEDVRKIWADINLEKFCLQVGIDFSKSFNRALELSAASADPYPEHQWAITENSRIPFGVLHLVPPSVSNLPTLWEEWFLEDGQLHHHVLRNHAHELATQIWHGELSDTDHPREVLGIQWHHSNDVDLRPVRYR